MNVVDDVAGDEGARSEYGAGHCSLPLSAPVEAMTAPKKKPAKRIGRPPRSGGEAAVRGVFVRFTNDEYAAIQAAAERTDKPLAAFIRDAALLISDKS